MAGLAQAASAKSPTCASDAKVLVGASFCVEQRHRRQIALRRLHAQRAAASGVAPTRARIGHSDAAHRAGRSERGGALGRGDAHQSRGRRGAGVAAHYRWHVAQSSRGVALAASAIVVIAFITISSEALNLDVDVDVNMAVWLGAWWFCEKAFVAEVCVQVEVCMQVGMCVQ